MNTAVVDPGKGPGEPSPPLFLDQTETWKAEKIFLRPAAPYLRVWMTAPPPHLYWKVHIRHCTKHSIQAN